jgi:uncharacterized SAM-binding protein YcdF (DUF218 family)
MNSKNFKIALLLFLRHKWVKKIALFFGCWFLLHTIFIMTDGFFPEGTAMKNYLIQAGVAEDDVLVDNKGDETYATAKNFIAWSKGKQYNSAIVVVVSQFFHITRSKYTLKKLGFTRVAGVASASYGWRDVPGAVREWPAFYTYLLMR